MSTKYDQLLEKLKACAKKKMQYSERDLILINALRVAAMRMK